MRVYHATTPLAAPTPATVALDIRGIRATVPVVGDTTDGAPAGMRRLILDRDAVDALYDLAAVTPPPADYRPNEGAGLLRARRTSPSAG